MNTADNRFATAAQFSIRPSGTVLFGEGEEPRGIYIIESGQVDLVFSAKNGAHKSLRSLHAGEILGLSDVVGCTKRDCTATTRTACRIGYVPANELRRMLAEDPSLWFGIAASLSSDLGSCWNSMRAL